MNHPRRFFIRDMKTLLKISIAANLLLLGGLILMWVGRTMVVAPAVSMVAVPVKILVTNVPVTAASAAPARESAPFRWQQLENRNYHRYVKNLRGIGCPEPSVRAIVTADVAAVYGRRRRMLEEKLAGLADSSWSNRLAMAGAEAGMRAELQDLPAAQERLVADLLGLPPAANPASAAPSTDAPAPEVSLPLVFQDIDPVKLNLSPEDQMRVAYLRQSFMKEIGGDNQNPDDPAYLARWQAAQPKYDSLLQGLLGNDVYNQLQMIEYQKTVDEQAARRTSPN